MSVEQHAPVRSRRTAIVALQGGTHTDRRSAAAAVHPPANDVPPPGRHRRQDFRRIENRESGFQVIKVMPP